MGCGCLWRFFPIEERLQFTRGSASTNTSMDKSWKTDGCMEECEAMVFGFCRQFGCMRFASDCVRCMLGCAMNCAMDCGYELCHKLYELYELWLKQLDYSHWLECAIYLVM